MSDELQIAATASVLLRLYSSMLCLLTLSTHFDYAASAAMGREGRRERFGRCRVLPCARAWQVGPLSNDGDPLKNRKTTPNLTCDILTPLENSLLNRKTAKMETEKHQFLFLFF